MDLSEIADSVKLSFIRPFTLPNFIKNFQSLNKQFDFLSNSNGYSQYYKSLESLSRNVGITQEPCKIDIFGHSMPLIPLRRKYTLNSYWQSIRFPLKSQEKKGITNNELFLLLPLKMSIPTITSIKVNNIRFPVRTYLYLFPFGSCCINMEVNIPQHLCDILKTKKNFNGLHSLITNLLKGSVLMDGIGSFEDFSLVVARQLNQVLFGCGDVIPFSTHTLIFFETSSILFTDYRTHIDPIVSAMERKNVMDVSTLTDEAINETISCSLNHLRNGEILLFSPMSTFIYPSPEWISKLRKSGNYITRRKLQCMNNNYRSFLNTIFAVNRYLKDSFLENKDKLPHDRSLEIIKCFKMAYPGESLNESNKIYFKSAFKPISQKIGLIKSLEEVV